MLLLREMFKQESLQFPEFRQNCCQCPRVHRHCPSAFRQFLENPFQFALISQFAVRQLQLIWFQELKKNLLQVLKMMGCTDCLSLSPSPGLG